MARPRSLILNILVVAIPAHVRLARTVWAVGDCVSMELAQGDAPARSTLAVVASTLAIAALFQPLRQRMPRTGHTRARSASAIHPARDSTSTTRCP